MSLIDEGEANGSICGPRDLAASAFGGFAAGVWNVEQPGATARCGAGAGEQGPRRCEGAADRKIGSSAAPTGNEYVAGRLIQRARSHGMAEDFSRRDELLKDALACVRKGDAPWFQEYLLLGHVAANLTKYRYPEAIQLYDQACGLALERSASADVVGDLLLRLGDVASPNGEWSLVVSHALHVRDRELGFPAYDEAVRMADESGAAVFRHQGGARSYARGGASRGGMGTNRRSRRSRSSNSRMRRLHTASPPGEYEGDRYRSSAVQVQLKLTRMLLREHGQRAEKPDATLKRIGHPGEQVHWAERNRLRMRIEAFRASGEVRVEHRC